MTPKEKAQELVDKFTNLYEGINLGLAKKHWAKQSVLIAVDEIIASNPIAFDEDDNCIAKQWWQEVKQEIELL
jgi:hypothetical protein